MVQQELARFEALDPWRRWWERFCMEPSKDQRKKKKLADDLVEYRQAVLDQAFVLQSRRMRVGAGLVKAARAILCTVDMVHTLPQRYRALFEHFPIPRSRISMAIVDEAG